MFDYFRNVRGNLRAGTGAGNLLLSTLIFGIALGTLSGVLNNFLAQLRDFNSFDRGVLEFFREIPGLLLVFILALYTDVGPVVLYCGVKLIDVIKLVVFHIWLKKERWLKNLTTAKA